MADVESFRARSPTELPPAPRPGHGVKRPKTTEPFLRGPIPIAWLKRAHRAGGASLTLGLALWFVRGVSGMRGPVKVSRSVRCRFGLSADQVRYGLQRLESARLVRFAVRGRGRCAVVEIVDDGAG